jgi:DNA-binding winged helix-turn-helix (wHTH) protein
MAPGIQSPRLKDSPFRLGEWLVDPTLSRIFRGDDAVHLEIRAMDVLVCLAENAPNLLTRHQLIDEVWGATTISDNTLTRVIADVRGALNDDARYPTYIETIHRRGYRMLQIPRSQEFERQQSWSARDRVWSTTLDPTHN